MTQNDATQKDATQRTAPLSTLSQSARGLLTRTSEWASRYEVGTFYADDSATTQSLSAFWAARKAGTVAPEASDTYDGPWKAALFEAYEDFGNQVDSIALDKHCVEPQAGRDATVGADVVFEQLDAMVGAEIDLEVDQGWQIFIPQLDPMAPVCVYLVRIR